MTIANAGTASFRYSMAATATNTLGLDADADRRTLGTSCATFDGTIGRRLHGAQRRRHRQPTQGAQAGDRTLAGLANEVLCFRVSLPLGTGDALQGGTSAATFTFAAEQTANNP